MKLNRILLNNSNIGEVAKWSNVNFDELSKEEKENYERFFKFGLCNITKDILELLKFYPNFESETSKTQTLAYANSDNEILGIAIIEFGKAKGRDEKTLFLHHLIIKPTALHKGIGSHIISDLQENSSEICNFPCEELYVCTEPQNTPMINLLTKLGFKKFDDTCFNIYKCPLKGKTNEL